MSAQLARRTGTVSALVAAASVTMVAGCWPALAAGAPDQRPGRVASAPGQERKAPVPVAEPVVSEPVAEPVAQEPVVAEPVAEPVVSEPVAEPVAQEPVVAEPVAADPATRPGKSGQAPGQVAKQPVPVVDTADEQPPAPEAVAEPVAQEPAPGQAQKESAGQAQKEAAPGQAQKEPAPGQAQKEPAAAPVLGPPTRGPAPVVGPPTGVTAPAKVQGPQVEAPAKVQGPKAEAPAPPAPPRPVAAPVAAAAAPIAPRAEPPKRPAAGPPVPTKEQQEVPPSQPRSAPVVAGPPVVDAVPESAVLSGGLTLAAPAARRGQGSATDPWPLRPTGSAPLPRRAAAVAQGPALPQAEPASASQASGQLRPPARPVDIGAALPALATGTVEAVASQPQIPAGIVAVVVVFLLLQSRIDRRDPKLAVVRIEDDAPLDFEPTEAVLTSRRLAAVS